MAGKRPCASTSRPHTCTHSPIAGTQCPQTQGRVVANQYPDWFGPWRSLSYFLCQHRAQSSGPASSTSRAPAPPPPSSECSLSPPLHQAESQAAPPPQPVEPPWIADCLTCLAPLSSGVPPSWSIRLRKWGDKVQPQMKEREEMPKKELLSEMKSNNLSSKEFKGKVIRVHKHKQLSKNNKHK